MDVGMREVDLFLPLFFGRESGEIWLWREDKEDRRRKKGGKMYKIVINWQIPA